MTTDLLDEDKRAYQGSTEERNDVKAAYQKEKGDMASVVEHVMHSNVLGVCGGLRVTSSVLLPHPAPASRDHVARALIKTLFVSLTSRCMCR